MNFATFRQLNPDNMIRLLIIYHTMELFEKSYKEYLKTSKLAEYPPDIQARFKECNEWWTARKLSTKSDTQADYLHLIKMLSLWEYL